MASRNTGPLGAQPWLAEPVVDSENIAAPLNWVFVPSPLIYKAADDSLLESAESFAKGRETAKPQHKFRDRKEHEDTSQEGRDNLCIEIMNLQWKTRCQRHLQCGTSWPEDHQGTRRQ